MTPAQMIRRVKELEKQMYQHAKDPEFEQAAQIRDQLRNCRAGAGGLSAEDFWQGLRRNACSGYIPRPAFCRRSSVG